MDDDEFGGDELDSLPDDTFHELEEKAFSSTQMQRAQTTNASANRVKTYNNHGLNRAKAPNKSNWQPPRPRQQPQPPRAQIIQNAALSANAPEPPSSDYGFDDEDIIDLDEPSMVIQPSAALPTRGRSETPARPVSRYGSKPVPDPETLAAFAAADAELGAPETAQWASAPHLQPRANDGIDLSGLQARIAELEAEQARLRQAETAARKAAQQKQGEIAIVRANQDKATKEYERRIAVMQKLHADESAKQKAELDAGKKEREKIATDNRFLQHDLAQEAERAKRLNGPGKARAAAAGNEASTPRKSKRPALGDGFNDDEVMIISPSRSRDKDKSRDQTPKAGAKRKRPVQDSPLPVLSFTQPAVSRKEERIESVQSEVESLSNLKEDRRYEFMQRLLNHRPYEGHERSLEALVKHALPSDKTTLSSKLMDGLSSLTLTPGDSMSLKLSTVALKLWSQCLEEKYYPPIYLLLDLTRFAIRLETASMVVQLVQEAVPICMRTIDLVANFTVLASQNASFKTTAEYTKLQTEIKPHIDVDEVLDFLQLLCDASSLKSETQERFWLTIDYSFLMLVMNRPQPLSQVITALRMVSTSCLPTSFGPICARDTNDAARQQSRQENDILERLTHLLFNKPEVPMDEEPYTQAEIAEFHLEILDVLKALCLTDHGGLTLAQHRNVLGRLMRFVESQSTRLYTIRPSLGLTDEHASDSTPHDLVVKTINATTRLIYHLVKTYDNNIDFLQKMRAVKGGYHKFLAAMTRLAFSDQLVLEAGIDKEVSEAAHEILDAVLQPEEGEAVMKAVETPRGTKGRSEGSTTEADTPEEEREAPG